MLPAPVDYVRPGSLDGALEALQGNPGARVLAGGQSLLNALKLRAARVDLLVDVGRLPELRGITREHDDTLIIHAGTTYAGVAGSEAVRAAQPVLARVAAHLVDRQVRARGTIGGNCCFNDPLSNLPPLLVALDARFRIAGAGGLREVGADDFFLAPYRTAVAQTEVLHSVVLPALPPGCGVGYQSLQVAVDSWALARAVARVDGDPIVAARVVAGCIGPRPLRRPAIEAALTGQARGAVDPAALGALASDGVGAFDDAHASGAYRLAMAEVVTERAIAEAIGRESV